MTIVTASPRRIRPAMVALVALVVGTLLALGMSAAPAHAITPVTFTVKLTNKTGTALTSYHVYAIGVLNGTELPDDTPAVGAAISGKPGSYSMALSSGEQYTLFFVPTGASATSGTVQYLGGTPILAQASTFTPSATNTFLTASIATGGTIVGTVTSPTGAVLSGAEVDEYEYDGSKWFSNNYTITNSHGQYSFTNVDPGSYKFEFYAPLSKYPPIYSGSQTTLAAAHSVFIAAGAKGTVNQKFAVSTGSISGTAQYRDEGSSALHARSGVVAGAFPVTGAAGNLTIDDDKAVYGAPANSKGQWSVGGLHPGTYVVQLQPGYFGEAANYIGTAGDNTDLQQATVLTVVAGQKTPAPTSVITVNDDADGAPDGASPDITVEDSGGNPLPGMKVQITQTTNPIGVIVSGTSASNGTVQLSYGDAAHTTVGPIYSQSGHVLPLAPSFYTVTVIAPQGDYEPYDLDQYLDFGSNALVVKLQAVQTPPAFATPPTIAETNPMVGTTYVVTGATANRPSADPLAYQWLRNGKPIYGATETSYQSVGADVKSQLSVQVTDSEFGFDPVYAVADVGGDLPEIVTPGDQLVNAAPPTITPTAPDYVGTTLQTHAGQWTIDGAPSTGLGYSYVWKRDGTAIAHATGSSYIVQTADLGHLITVGVQASKPGYATSNPVTSGPATPLAKPGIAATKAPAVTAKLVHGVTTYSVSNGSWNTSGLTYTYVWSVGGVPVSTESSVTSTAVTTAIGGTLPAADPLTAVVTANKTNYLPVSSPPVAAVKGTFAFTPVVGSSLVVTDQTGTPTVVNDSSDPLRFGDHLQVTTAPTWAPILHGALPSVPSGVKYQWYRNSDGIHTTAIAGATASTYTVGVADLNSANSTVLSVTATPISNYYAAVPTEQFVIGHAVHLSFPSTPSVFVSGKLAIGETVTAKLVGSSGVTGVTASYQWYYCPVAATPSAPACADENDASTFDLLKGATKSTLTLLSSYDAVAVVYRASKPGYTSVPVTSVPAGTSPASSVQVDLLSTPTIAGTTGGQAHVGAKLTATGFAYNTPVNLSYDWQQQQCVPGSCVPDRWAAIPSLVGHPQTSTYTPTVADFGTGDEAIRVVLNGTSIHGSSSDGANSPEYVLGYGAAKLTKTPTLATTTSAFTVRPGTYSVKGAAQTVVWYEDGAEVSPDTPTVLPRAGLGSRQAIYADVTYSVSGYQPVTTRLVAQKGATATTPGETMTGSRYGDTLGLSAAQPFSDVQSTARTLSYQWYSNGKAISGQTHSTFKPSSAYINHKIQVKVTGKSSLYLAGVVTPQLTLGEGVFTTPSTPNIGFTGTLMPGTIMTAAPAANYGTTGITFKYQWQRRANSGAAWSNVSKATSVHYTPVATDVTQQLRVIVTAVKSGYTSLAAGSSVADVHYSPDLAVFVPPALVPTGGVAKVGALLTLAPGAWNTPGLTYSYAWYVGDSSATGTLIPGVTVSSWTPTPTTYGDDITVAVTASRAGYVPVTVDSATVTVGLGSAPSALVAPVIIRSGSTYTVSPGSWNLDGLSFTYDWQVNGADVAPVDHGITYTPASGIHGALTLKVTATRGGYAEKDLTVLGPNL